MLFAAGSLCPGLAIAAKQSATSSKQKCGQHVSMPRCPCMLLMVEHRCYFCGTGTQCRAAARRTAGLYQLELLLVSGGICFIIIIWWRLFGLCAAAAQQRLQWRNPAAASCMVTPLGSAAGMTLATVV
jgi:hypothetical protein